MALRFQNGQDDVDQAVNVERRWLIPSFLAVAVIMAAVSFLAGESLRSYEEVLGIAFVCFWAAWLLSPLYHQLRIRSKEIHGMVTGIEQAISALNERHVEMLDRLHGLEDNLRSSKHDQHPSTQHYRLPLPD